MRVYLPTTLGRLRTLLAAGEVGPAPVAACAVTPTLREWYAGSDLEELEYAALCEAARESLRLLDTDPDGAYRRVVLSADVEDAAVTTAPEVGRGAVRLRAAVPMPRVVSAHVDADDAEQDVRAAAGVVRDADRGDGDAEFVVGDAEDHELLWYAAQELPGLLGRLAPPERRG